jgi:hypothetical protein
MEIRKRFYGLDPDPEKGIRLGSITTMGSPIGIFSLVDVKMNPRMASSKYDTTQREASSTHDITPSLGQLLSHLHQELGKTLPWRNFVHPGDPIASPLKGIVPNMVDKTGTYIDVQDILVPANVADVFKEPFPGLLTDLLIEPIKQTDLAVVGTPHAHGSYWESSYVVEEIIKLF